MTGLPGEALAEADFASLRSCGIPRKLAERAMLRRVDSAEGAELVGRNGAGDYSGIVFPYVWPGQDSVREYRLRRDHPEMEQQPDGTLKEQAKYVSPPGRRNMLYLVPGTEPEWLKDASLRVVITEGEKKTLALWVLGWHALGDAAERPRFLPVGLAGVWNWRGTVGKTTGPNGDRRDVKGVIPDFDRIEWKRRKVIIVFDTNVQTNNSVQKARRRLSEELARRGASVHWFEWEQRIAKHINGIDDLIGRSGPDYTRELLEKNSVPWRQGGTRPVPVWTLAELREAKLEETDPIIEGILAAKETIAIVGRPKVGKSRLTEQLALSVSRAEEFIGHSVPRRGRVLILDLENRPEGTRARFLKMAGPSEADANIFIYAPETLANLGVTAATRDGLKMLEQLVRRVEPDVLIIDTWRLLLGGDENKSDVILQGLKALSRLRLVRPQLSTIVVHHLRKQQGDSPAHLRIDPSAWIQAVSGSYSFIGHLDAAFGLEREVDHSCGEELIVFGGVARNAVPRTVLLDEDPDTLLFHVSGGAEAFRKIATPREREIWEAVQALDDFTFTEALKRAETKNKKAVASALRKAESAGLLTRDAGKRYRRGTGGAGQISGTSGTSQ